MNVPDLGLARASLAAARRERAEWLMSVATSLIAIDDVLAHAATTHGRALLPITLRQLLLAQPRWGQARTTATLETVFAFASTPPPTRATIAWLLDPRAGGGRYLAWRDALTVHQRTTPWPGFPFTPAPATTAAATVADLARLEHP